MIRVSSKGHGRLDDLHQEGSMKALFPTARGGVLDAVLLNTSGGVTGGDRFLTEARAGEGSCLRLTTQAAERFYRAQPDETGRVSTSLTIESGATLFWLPQETIVFDGARVARDLSIDLAETGRLLVLEPLIFGRAAMGEVVESGSLREEIRLRKIGKLSFLDISRLSGDMAAQLDRGAGGARAMASLLFAAPGAEAILTELRGLLGPKGGASLVAHDTIFARVLAEDGWTLRRLLVPVIRRLSGLDLPKTWTL